MHGSQVCRNIRTLFNFDPPATEDEICAAAIQYVRKVSGTRSPSKRNQAVFEQAVAEISDATRALVRALKTDAPPKNREEERQKARERNAKRFSKVSAG